MLAEAGRYECDTLRANGAYQRERGDAAVLGEHAAELTHGIGIVITVSQMERGNVLASKSAP